MFWNHSLGISNLQQQPLGKLGAGQLWHSSLFNENTSLKPSKSGHTEGVTEFFLQENICQCQDLSTPFCLLIREFMGVTVISFTTLQ